LVGGHAIARGVNDGDALAADKLDELVHPWGEFVEAANRVQAMVVIPDVADDQRRPLCLPRCRSHTSLSCDVVLLLNLGAAVKGQIVAQPNRWRGEQEDHFREVPGEHMRLLSRAKRFGQP
jgi:hypothetical protein